MSIYDQYWSKKGRKRVKKGSKRGQNGLKMGHFGPFFGVKKGSKRPFFSTFWTPAEYCVIYLHCSTVQMISFEPKWWKMGVFWCFFTHEKRGVFSEYGFRPLFEHYPYIYTRIVGIYTYVLGPYMAQNRVILGSKKGPKKGLFWCFAF